MSKYDRAVVAAMFGFIGSLLLMLVRDNIPYNDEEQIRANFERLTKEFDKWKTMGKMEVEQ